MGWRKLVGAFVILLSASQSFAGSRGFVAVFVSIGPDDFFASSLYVAYRDANFVTLRDARNCWNRSATGGASISEIVRKKIPTGITIEMAKSAWRGDSLAIRKMQSILEKSESPDGKTIDGVLIISAEDDHIALMALGSRGPLGEKNPSKKVTIPWSVKDPEAGAAAFDLALCSVSKPLGIGFGP